jgi:small-conductance mechanosensitive channel
MAMTRTSSGLLTGLLVVAGSVLPVAGAWCQDEATAAAIVASSTRADHPATFTYCNRAIAELRATVLSRAPADRAAAAVRVLDRLIEDGSSPTVSIQPLGGARMMAVNGQSVFAILPLDVETLAGETLDGNATLAASHLERALQDAIEARTPVRLLTDAAQAVSGTLMFIGLIWLQRRLHRRVIVRLDAISDRLVDRLHAGEVVRGARIARLLRRGVTFTAYVLGLLLTYNWLTFVLKRFPYTRPWGESLRSLLIDNLERLGVVLLWAAPGVCVVLLIMGLTRLAVRLSNWFFDAVGHGQITAPGVHPDTAPSTRRLAAALLWLFALALAYPFLPGSGSEAFKGVSVFVGLMISLGSSGIINQMMSGLTITYARALRIGDFVRIGDVEGTVIHSGALSTKVRTNRQEEVTIPNAVVVSQVTTNYSRGAEADGVYVATSVTIGYDTPWRQVQALLLIAAEHTPGVRHEPAPRVILKALGDFYVEYVLLICPERPDRRVLVLDGLHARILDAFNEYGVQIMSPNYESDPHAPKVVPRDQWYAPPARVRSTVGRNE